MSPDDYWCDCYDLPDLDADTPAWEDYSPAEQRLAIVRSQR